MNKEIILIDLFSGIGGFALGLKNSGFNIKKHYFSEIDKHAIANYKHNFKNAEYIGSVTDVSGRELREKHKGETKKISKTQRYKMCGNAVTSKIVEFIGTRLLKK